MSRAERIDALRRAYRLFNARDVDALLTMMTPTWPTKPSRGPEEIRPCWAGPFTDRNEALAPE